MKFGRNYRLQIDMKDGEGILLIQNPLTCQLTMNRNISASLNVLTVDIYNLGDANRKRVFQDRYDTSQNRELTFEAGYGGDYSTVFKGNIFRANSVRHGSDFITSIECRTGQFDTINTTSSTTYANSRTVRDLLVYLCQQLPNVTIGAIGDFPEILPREIVLNGNVYDMIKRYSGGNVNIDNGKIYILRNDEVSSEEEFVLDASTGLIETPRRDDAFITVQTLFEPRIMINSKVKLNSVSQPIYNGEYKVLGVQHTGTISEAIGGDCRSVFNLYQPTTIFKTVKNGS